MLLHADGFDHYGLDLGRVPTELIVQTDGYSGCVRWNIISQYSGIFPPNGVGMIQAIGYQSVLYRPITSTFRQSSQFRICWPDGLNAVGYEPWGFAILDASNNVILKWCFMNNGAIAISSNESVNPGNILGRTAPGVVKPRTFQHFEFVYQPNTGTANGKAEIWQEGILILQINGLPIGTTPGSHFWGWQSIQGNSPQMLLKDWIIADASGTQNNVIPLGPRRTGIRTATGVGANNAWVPTGAATNWQAMGKITPNTSSYSSGANNGDIQDLTIPVSQPTTYSISGVLLKVNAQKSTGGVAAFKLGLQSGGVVQNSSDLIPGTSFVYYSSPFIEVDPNTNNPFTKAAYDAIGLRVTRSA